MPASRDVPVEPRKGGVCRRHGARLEVKRCSFEGCTKLHTWSNKSGGFGGVYFIKTNNNPTPQPNDVTHAILSCQLMNYEDEEEELNLWIWRSNACMTRLPLFRALNCQCLICNRKVEDWHGDTVAGGSETQYINFAVNWYRS